MPGANRRLGPTRLKMQQNEGICSGPAAAAAGPAPVRHTVRHTFARIATRPICTGPIDRRITCGAVIIAASHALRRLVLVCRPGFTSGIGYRAAENRRSLMKAGMGWAGMGTAYISRRNARCPHFRGWIGLTRSASTILRYRCSTASFSLGRMAVAGISHGQGANTGSTREKANAQEERLKSY
jgi:hypothetical protein